MKEISKRITTSILALLLIGAILSPSILKLSHALFEHQEQVCEEIGSVHFHEIEIDCDFQKYKLSTITYVSLGNNAVLKIEIPQKRIFNYYNFLSSYQSLHFALRGPPALT